MHFKHLIQNCLHTTSYAFCVNVLLQPTIMYFSYAPLATIEMSRGES